jgi:integrase
LAVIVTVAKGYDLGYIWKTQGQQASPGRTTGGYYINAAQAGEPPGRWWGPGAQALGLTSGQVVERTPYDAVYQQRDPRTGDTLGRPRGRYATFADHLAQLKAAEPHATAERVIELEREAAQATRQPAAYTDVTVSFSKSISVLRPGLKDVRRPAALMHAYIVLSLLCGLRTEEARALRWAHVDLDGDPAARPPVPPHVAVWRSVRAHGETKTERSRRTLALPAVAVQALRAWADSQAGEQLAAGQSWQDTGLVFTSHLGAALDAGNVRKMFKRICAEAGVGDGWTPRELRTTFVSLMSHQGVSIEEIARLAGHATTRTTEIVYRRELRPVITTGAEIMDELFSGN